MQIALRVPAEWLREADELVERLKLPGLAQTRSDILRRAIAEGLSVLREEAEGHERKPKR
jgi:hypothetical protein